MPKHFLPIFLMNLIECELYNANQQLYKADSIVWHDLDGNNEK